MSEELVKPPCRPDLGRRRFTRAGLSGSVILGSLASKPVLGAVPYHCTVSGQVSGNLSRLPGLAEACVIGHSRSYWLRADEWPEGFLKGTLPQAGQGCAFGDENAGEGTIFNGYTPNFGGLSRPSLVNAFYRKAQVEVAEQTLGEGAAPPEEGAPPPEEGASAPPSPQQEGTAVNPPEEGTCIVVLKTEEDVGSLGPATMHQVLASEDPDPRFELGRAVVVSLLNAAEFGAAYPVTPHSIIAMFNATFHGGIYTPNAGMAIGMWPQDRVIDYLTSLYRADGEDLG